MFSDLNMSGSDITWNATLPLYQGMAGPSLMALPSNATNALYLHSSMQWLLASFLTFYFLAAAGQIRLKVPVASAN